MLAEPAIRSVYPHDGDYPRLLSEIPSPPSPLFVRGFSAWNIPCIAIVGTRKASTEGKNIAKKLALDLVRNGFCIVSGLAFGIDAAAHEGALEGNGKTIAVLANGLDVIYPRQHESLAQKILSSGGALVSEYPEHTPSLPHQFLERNRIISGLSIAVVVIEAPTRSGSIATAHHAAEQGREVFVIPGSSRDTNYFGSHQLIRNGARLVTSSHDILEDLGYVSEKHISTNVSDDFSLESYRNNKPVYEILLTIKNEHAPISIDKISELTTLEPRIIAEQLTSLIIDGIVEEKNGMFMLSL